jgi:hypothetical protein
VTGAKSHPLQGFDAWISRDYGTPLDVSVTSGRGDDLMTQAESRSRRRARLDTLRESILHREVLARHLPAIGGPA